MSKKNYTVKGQKYKIKYVKEINYDGGVVGLCDKNSKTILVRESESEFNFMWTILHEIFHACLHETSLSSDMGEREEDAIVDNLSREALLWMSWYYKNFKDKETKNKK